MFFTKVLAIPVYRLIYLGCKYRHLKGFEIILGFFFYIRIDLLWDSVAFVCLVCLLLLFFSILL